MELLIPQLNQVVYSVVAFFILLFALSRFAFPPIQAMLKKRADEIKESLEAAERTRQEAQDLLEDYKQQLAQARAEAQQIVEQGRKLGETMKQEIIQKAQKEAEQLVNRAAADITREKELAMAELQSKVASLAVEAAAQVIRQSLDKQAHEKLIEQYLAEVGKVSEN